MIIDEEQYLAHYGTPRHSGRYPWGSGGNNAPQDNETFLQHIKRLLGFGMTEGQIAQGYGMSVAQLRAVKSIETQALRQHNIDMARRLSDKGNSTNAIAKRMGYPESTVRNWLKPGERDKTDVIQATAKSLKQDVDSSKGFIDIGAGVENHIGVSDTRLGTAVEVLKQEGYVVHRVKVQQLGTGFETTVKVLCPPGTTWADVQNNQDKIQQVSQISQDGGRTFYKMNKPLPISSNRVAVNYDEDGGSQADGVIYVREGVPDVSLGGSRYAQVRISVDGTHYLKGMAMYHDDIPDGADLVFNTNKKKADLDSKKDAFKKIDKDAYDEYNPFGAQIKGQVHKKDPAGNVILDKDGRPEVTSVMNIVSDQGDWGNWSRSISSQVLSKQSPKVARQQLDMYYEKRNQELEEILALDNPAVKKKLLQSFADGADAASVHLKAAQFKDQGWHAILPLNDLPPTQVYAPNYKNGDQVVLIRYPHGGVFEIPELTVNNNHPSGKKLIGSDAPDAIGIHHSVAERLSGADFDGDTVLVIPNRNKRIKTAPSLEQLKGFDPKREYAGYPGMKVMSNTQMQMGDISNLITDMTIKEAPMEHIARAVRHSMVVIDAEKHKLNYKASYDDNGIKALKDKYQRDPETGSSGASTIISRAGSKVYFPERKPRPQSQGGPIDPKTGEKVYVETGKVSYRTGKPKLARSKKLAETKDATTLSSGTPIENIYADHSNKLKALANKARLEYLNAPDVRYRPSAAKAYASEVSSLTAKLDAAKRNRPRERQAQLIANSTVKMRRQDNPNLDDDTRKKIERQALADARSRTGADKQSVIIDISPREWEAIQAGAISNNKLTEILRDVDLDKVREQATPKSKVLMTSAKTSRAQAMLASGFTRADVAEALGVSLSTLDRSL